MKKAQILFLVLALLLALLPQSKATATDAASGSLNETITWKYEDEVLVITGTGSIDGLSEKNEAPWYHLRDAITTIVIGEGIDTIGKWVFKDLTELHEIHFPTTLRVIGIQAFINCSSLEAVTLPHGVVSILRGAFKDCTNLKYFIMPNSVKTMENDVFKNCTSLEIVQLSAKLTELPSECFTSCTALSSITLPESITVIGSRAFMDCSSLAEVTFLGPVTEIGHSAFENCTSLLSVEFPASVEEIGSQAFSRCSALESVYFRGDAPEVSSFAFYLDKNDGDAPCVIYYPADNESWIAGRERFTYIRFEDEYVLEAYQVPKCDHAAVIIPGKAATCTEAGLTEGSICSSCGKVLKAQVAIDALGHDLMTVTLEPNCTEPGFDLYQCSRCAHRETGNIVQPLGHDFGDWETIKEATMESAGLAQRSCAICGESEQQELEQLLPSPGESQPTNPATQPAASDEPLRLAPAKPEDRALASVGVVLVLLVVTAAIFLVKWLTRKLS